MRVLTFFVLVNLINFFQDKFFFIKQSLNILTEFL
jgi:hypothetical protein